MAETILLTGASGFLGQYINKALSAKGFNMLSIGRSAGNTVYCDISKEIPVFSQTFEVVVHAAGKAHIVPKTDEEKKDFWQVNLTGTQNLIKGIENASIKLKLFIFISTVSVYGVSQGENINENAPLAATDPYGKSKIETEQWLAEWCGKNGVKLCILRLPLIAGQNPPGNLGAMIKGIKKGFYLSIGKASAKKSVVLAADVAELIPQLFDKEGIYNLTDGYHPSFGELEKLIAKQLGKKPPVKIPMLIARLLGFGGDILSKFPINSNKLKKIVSTLTFSDEKARRELNWNPHKVLESFTIK